jgi:hypothetical protein
VAQWLVVPGSRVSPDVGTLRRPYVDEGLSLAAMAARLGWWLRRCTTGWWLGEELSHLYGDCGLSLRDLAERYGVTTGAVRGWLVAAGIDRRPSGTARVDCDGDELVAL